MPEVLFTSASCVNAGTLSSAWPVSRVYPLDFFMGFISYFVFVNFDIKTGKLPGFVSSRFAWCQQSACFLGDRVPDSTIVLHLLHTRQITPFFRGLAFRFSPVNG